MIVKPSAFGDIVQSLPVLAAVKERFPDAEVSWVVNRAFAPFLKPIPSIDEVIEFDRGALGKFSWSSIRGLSRFLYSLRQREFDLAIDLQGLFKSGLMTWATGARRRIGLLSAREGARAFYTDVVDDLPHWQKGVDRYWRVAEQLGSGDGPKRFPIAIGPEERAWAARQSASLPRPLLVISPGAGWETKRWAPEKFAQAANQALNGKGSVVIVGGPGEVELSREVQGGLNVPCLNLAGKSSLPQVAALLKQANLLFTNDTGPLHLAAALEVPTVSVYLVTSPSHAGPYGDSEMNLIAQTCESCARSEVRRPNQLRDEHREAIRALTVNKVVPLLKQGLGRATP